MAKKNYEGYERYNSEGDQYTDESGYAIKENEAQEPVVSKEAYKQMETEQAYERFSSDDEGNENIAQKEQTVENTVLQEQVKVSAELKENPKSLKEIGMERRAAVLEKGKNTWAKIRGGFSKGLGMIKEKANNVVDYAFAAPEAIKKGAHAVGQAGLEAGQYATGKVVEVGEFATEKAKNAKAKVEDGAKFVLNKAQEGYDTLSSRGQQAYEKLKGRVDAAKDRWNDYRNQKRIEKLKLEAQQLEGAESSEREVAAAAVRRAELYQNQKNGIQKKIEELKHRGNSFESVAEASA